jgi:hypothetical protein
MAKRGRPSRQRVDSSADRTVQLILDFSDHEPLLTALRENAGRNFRSLELQALYYIYVGVNESRVRTKDQ